MRNLDQIGERVRANFDEKYRVREEALRLAREVIQSSAVAIRSIHRSEFAEARGLIAKARTALDRAKDVLANHPDIHYAGFVHDAAKEYAEASQTYAVVVDEALPDPEALGVSFAAYVNALGETVGELRRRLLD